MRRAAVIVLDGCGVGALPDAAAYGDEGANTLGHLADVAGGLELPTLEALGLGNILPLRGVPPSPSPVEHGRLAAVGPGKDSTTGHWELMGVVLKQALPTYPDGFPPEVIAALEDATGQRFCCNRPYSGTEVIKDYGEHHLRTGEPILYTSADSVLQLATHVERFSEQELYAICETARAVMQGEHAVGRVIARPFEGGPGSWRRREGRHDYVLPPPTRSYLEELQSDGVPVHGVGKIRDLFAGVGIDVKHPGATNVEGFCTALQEIDRAVARWLGLLGEEDLLVLTADHGVDPTASHTDHTREYAPLLARFKGHRGRPHDGPLSDVGASVLRWLSDRDAPALPGGAFL
jgi:phosphopentomutase